MKINLFITPANLSKITATILFLICFQSILTAQNKACGEKDYECQVAAATKTILANPRDASGYRARGDAYYNSGQYDLAATDYTKVLEIEPRNGEMYCYRGDAYYYLKNYSKAAGDYTTAISFDYQNAEMFIKRGNSYDILDNFDAAMKDYNQALKLDPNSAGAYYNRGIAQLSKDKNKQAIEDFQKALKIDPEYPDAQKYLEIAQTAKQAKDAKAKAKWAAFGKALDQMTNQSPQSSAPSSNQKSTNGGNTDSQATTGNRSTGGSPSEADVKAWVKEYEDEINPTGGVSSPISISLSFNQISYETPRAANEGDRLRKVKSDQLYPVIVDYTVNQKFSDGTYPKRKKWKFEFYINTEGTWSAFSYGPAE